MKIIIFMLLFFSQTVQAISFSSLNIDKDNTPYLLQILLNHLKNNPPTNVLEQENLITTLTKLNEKQKLVSKKQFTFVVNSETHKTILNHKIKSGVQSSNVSLSDLSNIESKLKASNLIYTDFAKFVLTESIRNFEEYKKDNFLEKYQNVNPPDKKGQIKKGKLKQISLYTGKWINKGLSSTPQNFNNYLSEVSMTILNRLVNLLEVYKLHSQTTVGRVDILTNIPSPSNGPNLEKQKSLKLPALEVDPMEGSSKKIDNLLRDINIKEN